MANPAGSPLKEVCVRGHNLAETRRRSIPSNRPYCVECKAHRRKVYRAQINAWHHTPKAKRARFVHNLKTYYGLTVEDYDLLYKRQKGLCAICKNPPQGKDSRRGNSKLHIDHDHKTKQIRGLLCNLCNAAVGFLRDDPVIVRSAAAYIERYQQQDLLSQVNS